MSVVGLVDEEVTGQFGDWDGLRVSGDVLDLLRAEIPESYLSASYSDCLMILK